MSNERRVASCGVWFPAAPLFGLPGDTLKDTRSHATVPAMHVISDVGRNPCPETQGGILKDISRWPIGQGSLVTSFTIYKIFPPCHSVCQKNHKKALSKSFFVGLLLLPQQMW